MCTVKNKTQLFPLLKAHDLLEEYLINFTSPQSKHFDRLCDYSYSWSAFLSDSGQQGFSAEGQINLAQAGGRPWCNASGYRGWLCPRHAFRQPARLEASLARSNGSTLNPPCRRYVAKPCSMMQFFPKYSRDDNAYNRPVSYMLMIPSVWTKSKMVLWGSWYLSCWSFLCSMTRTTWWT